MRSELDYLDVPDEDLERAARAALTPELVEWCRRLTTSRTSIVNGACNTSAQFNYRLGMADGRASLIESMETLLSEATDPEKHFDNGSS